jgi:hypothetical protein
MPISPAEEKPETIVFQETEFLTGIARNTALASSTARSSTSLAEITERSSLAPAR